MIDLRPDILMLTNQHITHPSTNNILIITRINWLIKQIICNVNTHLS